MNYWSPSLPSPWRSACCTYGPLLPLYQCRAGTASTEECHGSPCQRLFSQCGSKPTSQCTVLCNENMLIHLTQHGWNVYSPITISVVSWLTVFLIYWDNDTYMYLEHIAIMISVGASQSGYKCMKLLVVAAVSIHDLFMKIVSLHSILVCMMSLSLRQRVL